MISDRYPTKTVTPCLCGRKLPKWNRRMTVTVHDNRRCELGEGPLWHPELGQLFWFDILGKQLMTRTDAGPRRWQFDEFVSAAGWVDRDTLLIASESRLFKFTLSTGREDDIAPLEADNQDTRSNDGRADRQGGFWIGMMGKSAQEGMGTIYRYYKGEVRKLVEGIRVPNGMCFSPVGTQGYYSCSGEKKVYRLQLDKDGWPKGKAEVFLDLSGEGLAPDGAVTDAEGNYWSAQWGSYRVAGYTPDGTFIEAYDIPARHSSCPAWGGPGYQTLFCTSALENLAPEDSARSENGMTFAVTTQRKGLPEPQVKL